MLMLFKKGLGLLWMLLCDFAQSPGKRLYDHVFLVRCQQRTDPSHVAKVAWISAPAKGNGADQRSAPPPVVSAASPGGDHLRSDLALRPQRAGKIHGETIDRRPTIESLAKLQKIVRRESFESGT